MENPEISKELTYDLRQIYAVEIVGFTMKCVMESRMTDNYSDYLKHLWHWHIVIRHKFKKPEADEEEYKKLYQRCVDAANKHRGTFLELNRNGVGINELQMAFAELEMFLYQASEDANLFGAKIERDPSKALGGR